MGNDFDETGSGSLATPLIPIFVSAQCNQRCISCPGRPSGPLSQRQIQQKLAQHDRICLLGGEPTLNRSLLGLIRQAKANGSGRVALSTNGLRLSFRHYVKACLDAGLDEILFAFPSHQRAACDALTGVDGSYEHKIQALRHLTELAQGSVVTLVHLVCEPTYLGLAELVRFVRGEFPSVGRIVFKLVECVGAAAEKTDLLPDFDLLRPRLEESLELCRAWGLDGGVSGVPWCVYPHYAESVDQRLSQSLGVPPDTRLWPPPTCGECRFEDRCGGIPERYLRTRG